MITHFKNSKFIFYFLVTWNILFQIVYYEHCVYANISQVFKGKYLVVKLYFLLFLICHFLKKIPGPLYHWQSKVNDKFWQSRSA